MSNKFEQLLDLLVNEEKDKAESLFHDIVVERSKEIYQGLIESEEKADEKEVDEATETKDEETTESKDEEATDKKVDEFVAPVDAESIEEIGGDAADDMINDIEADTDADMDKDFDADGKMDDHEEEHGDIEDRVVDLEDALDELKAEFDAMSNDEDEDDAEGEEGDDEGEKESVNAELATEEPVYTEEAVEEEQKDKSAGETMREYVEKVSAPANKEGADNTASPVASKGGKDSGANGSNIAQSSEEKGGSAVKAKDMGKSFENEPGSKAGDTFKKASAPKSAE